IARYEARLIKVKRHRNSLLPISRLHRELLHYIFELALSDEGDGSIDSIPSLAYYTALFVLRRVSHRWDDEIEFRARVPADENLGWYLVDHDHPRMRALSLYGEEQILCTRPLRTPRLTELNITACNITWDGLQNLRVLSVSSCSGPNLAQLVHVLQSSPLLERLSLMDFEAISDGAEVPLNTINLPQLSTLLLGYISFDLAYGLLERLSPSSMCWTSEIEMPWSEELGLSGFVSQAGRICTTQSPGGPTIYPQLCIDSDLVQLKMGPHQYLRIFVDDWHSWENQAKLQRVADVARMFFETSRRQSLKTQISQFLLEVHSTAFVAGGLTIVQELFPETVDLEVVTIARASFDALQVLAEPVINEGNPVWLLPKVAVLRLTTYDATFNYDTIIPMVIKRTQAAASSPSALSPITLLTFANGVVHPNFLVRLGQAGINYERQGQNVILS
ncbi:hypothetical protein FRC01_009397, partial [Tulasnella sp. 417]